ncbi:MAG TPA: protein kinase [Ktedonobacteraceae bacterium]|nr:protein kinase [Ktedonobacteraceae bacterium]
MAEHGEREGQQLDNYLLLRLLGQGAFGEVYLAEHVRRRTQVAVKVLLTRLSNEELHMFLNEARVFRLKHPHIVPVIDFGVERKNNTPFLVMDYAPNGTLRQRHPPGVSVPLSMVVSYVRDVASALQYAHEEDVIHRDIKPANLLIGQRGEILVSDFGISIITQAGHTSLQSLQQIGGSPSYMAPELWLGKASQASDQYALAITVYEWLCGVRPFEGDIAALAHQHANVLPPSLRAKVPTLPPDVEQVILTALAKNPRQRFASVRAFALALEQAAQLAASAPIEPVPPLSQASLSAQPTILPDQSSPSIPVVSEPQITVPPQITVLPQHTSPSNQISQSYVTIPPSVPPPDQPPPYTPQLPPQQPPQRRTLSRRTVVATFVGLGVVAGTAFLLAEGVPKSIGSIFGFGVATDPTATTPRVPHTTATTNTHNTATPSTGGTASPTTGSTPSPTTGGTPNPTPGSTSTPVVSDTPTPTSITYKVSVVTGDVPGAGTDANVYLSIYGDVASSTDNRLNSTIASFEKGQTDIFYLTLPDLGNLQKITIYHDNTGVAPGWYLDRVIITNSSTGQYWTFSCNCWLAVDEGDGSITRTIYAS